MDEEKAEKTLIEQYLLHDEEAQRALYEKYTPLIWKIIFREILVDRCPGADVDDLFQEGLIALDNAIIHYDTNRDISLFGLAEICIRRRMKSFLYRQYRGYHAGNTVSLDWQVSETENPFLYEVIADPHLFDFMEDNVEFVHLKPIERRIVELRADGYKYHEIAELLHISTKTVDNAMQRIRRRLRTRKHLRASRDSDARSRGK